MTGSKSDSITALIHLLLIAYKEHFKNNNIFFLYETKEIISQFLCDNNNDVETKPLLPSFAADINIRVDIVGLLTFPPLQMLRQETPRQQGRGGEQLRRKL